MSDPRITGLLLMATSIAAFVGTTSEMLPPVTFFPALALFGLGALKFLRTNHEVLKAAEERTERALNPVMRENRQARAHAERQAARQGTALARSAEFDAHAIPTPPAAARSFAPGEPIDIDDRDDDFVIATDVSFPIDVQMGDALADQLRKLNQLLEQGVLTAEEYALAKTKILS